MNKARWALLAGVVLGFCLAFAVMLLYPTEVHAAGYSGTSGVKWASEYQAMRVDLGYKDDGTVVWR